MHVRILLLESVLITLKQVNTSVVKKKTELAKDLLVRCCKLSLYVSGSCDEHAVYFQQ